MKIIVCIGSSCHVKGSRSVVDELHALIASNNLEGKVELGGTFCTGNCRNGVNVAIDEKIYSITAETAKEFFDTVVLPMVK